MTNVGCQPVSSPSEESFLSLSGVNGLEEFAVSWQAFLCCHESIERLLGARVF